MEEVEKSLTTMGQEMEARGFSSAEIAAARSQASGAVYENRAQRTNVFVDDVDVKKHKAHRDRSAQALGSTEASDPQSPLSVVAGSAGKPRPKVANTVARIEQGSKGFTLSGDSLGQVVRFVLAFLLHNDLLSGRVYIFTEGYQSLQNTIMAFFARHPRVWLVLDWFSTWSRNSKRT
jgi:hypothetical protein